VSISADYDYFGSSNSLGAFASGVQLPAIARRPRVTPALLVGTPSIPRLFRSTLTASDSCRVFRRSLARGKSKRLNP